MRSSPGTRRARTWCSSPIRTSCRASTRCRGNRGSGARDAVAMLAYAAKRLGLAILVALFVSAVAFALLRLSGDPALAIAGENARQADIDLVRKTYGLDRPLVVQYLEWLWTIARGDLGQSLYFRTDVWGLMAD